MALGDYCSGIQHLGIPTGDLDKTKEFYQGLGFQTAYETCIEAKNQRVAFLQLKNLMIEAYEEPPVLKEGAINHVALDCSQIEEAYEAAVKGGYKILSDGIEDLDFWEHGVRFFIIEGPNRERIEFCEKCSK